MQCAAMARIVFVKSVKQVAARDDFTRLVTVTSASSPDDGDSDEEVDSIKDLDGSYFLYEEPKDDEYLRIKN